MKSEAPKVSGMKKRIFVVEDHLLMRRSIVEAIERDPDLAVCGHAEGAQAAIAAIVSLQPDLVLTDIQLKSSSGLSLIKALRARAADIPVVATTMFDTCRAERLARTAGAAAFVPKQDGPDKLIAAVHEVLKTGKRQDQNLLNP